MTVTVHLIAAARPNFMKVAPLYHAMIATDWCSPKIVHTGQHYDVTMSDVFFSDLGLPAPDFHLGIGSGTHAEQTGGVMIAYEAVCAAHRPDWIVVVGDVNSTAACAIVGAKLGIPVVHLEAGLRSSDRSMPEEINRLLTDSVADVLWTPCADADENLLAEGVPKEKIEMIGNIMIDSIEMLRGKIEDSSASADLKLDNARYALVTLHRPSNVDDRASLASIIRQLLRAAGELPIVFVTHPRTMKNIARFGLRDLLESSPGILLLEPLPYVQFMNVVMHAALVITDSGGLQEETTYLGIPCLTLRANTERPVTIARGTNRLVIPGKLVDQLRIALRGKWPKGSRPPLWDGKTARRAVSNLKKRSGIEH